MAKEQGWIGVDLDGTLAEWHGWKEPGDIGPPVPAMVDRVKRWLDDGEDVRIFTARVSPEGHTEAQLDNNHRAIWNWCLNHFRRVLRVTHSKDIYCKAIYDDRAYRVRRNTGEVIGEDT